MKSFVSGLALIGVAVVGLTVIAVKSHAFF
ncbi:hypothetical protein B0G84_3251 [Paraburkholderia sp. BL8N3]|nr:hypothetical protein B0G84_3251 [Paraburkholderia sp. BL8N3]